MLTGAIIEEPLLCAVRRMKEGKVVIPAAFLSDTQVKGQSSGVARTALCSHLLKYIAPAVEPASPPLTTLLT